MAIVPAPMEICQKVSARAQQLARENMSSRNWSERSIEAMMAFPGEGQVGLKTTAKYLMYQEKGIKPFVMWWASGRVIPLPGGPRRAVGVGTPGWVTLPGGVRKWRDQRWRHPGLKPKNFMQDALAQAIEEVKPELQRMLMDTLRSATDAK